MMMMMTMMMMMMMMMMMIMIMIMMMMMMMLLMLMLMKTNLLYIGVKVWISQIRSVSKTKFKSFQYSMPSLYDVGAG